MTTEELLASSGLLVPATLSRAKLVQDETGEPLDAVICRLGMASEQGLAELFSRSSRLPMVDRNALANVIEMADWLSPEYLKVRRVLPIRDADGGMSVAFANPFDEDAVSALTFAFGGPIRPVVALASDIDAVIEARFGLESQDIVDDVIDSDDLERLRDLASDAPVIRAVNRLISQAVELRASDIHIEPGEDMVAVRFRVDGVMRQMEALPIQMRAALISRIKVMASLNIAERRLPQDGRLRFAVRGQEIDLRVASSPTIHGEAMVLRLLDRSGLVLDFDTLGFDPALASAFGAAVHQPHGMVLVTGPTGSGKTTTLYAALALLNDPERKLLTVEDPIEYRLPGVNQTQVQPAIGLTFASALRSFLRQDPDVMMVGEIRDLETAQIAIQAALTGHMILSTLHTNGAAAAVTRLIDMGVEPFLIASTLNGVLAQRLARRLCGECRAPYAPDPALLASLDAPADAVFHRAVGCPACGGSGYRGRIALLEFLPVDERIAHLVNEGESASAIEAAARSAGGRSLREDGVAKALAGLTTIEEVLRILRDG